MRAQVRENTRQAGPESISFMPLSPHHQIPFPKITLLLIIAVDIASVQFLEESLEGRLLTLNIYIFPHIQNTSQCPQKSQCVSVTTQRSKLQSFTENKYR